MREQVGVERHLLERGLQAAFHPAGAVHQQIDAAHDRAPQREHALIGRLGVERVGGVGVGRAIGQAEPARELAADHRGLHVFRRAEGRRARLHVDVGGEAAIDEGRARPRESARSRGRRAPRHAAGRARRQRHRRHRAGEREGGQHDDLIAPRHLDARLPASACRAAAARRN